MSDLQNFKKVSVIIPSYKGASLIYDTLDSIVRQTYPNWEAIVVEDGSEDGTQEICEKIQSENKEKKILYYRHDQNRGVGPARNTAMALATGVYYAFLDHDDFWRPEYLEIMIKQLEEQNADIAYSSVQCFEDKTKEKLSIWGPTEEDLASFPNGLFGRNFITPSGAIIKKKAQLMVGPFDEDPQIQSCEDHDFWIRCVENRLKFTFVKYVLSWYRKNGLGQATANNVRMLQRDLLVLKKHRKLKLIPEFEKQQAFAKIYTLLAQAKKKTSRWAALVCIIQAWASDPMSLSNLRRVSSFLKRFLFGRPETLSF